jgi:long-chain fatty acid transport protein
MRTTILLAVCISAAAHAQPMDTYGMGSRSVAMAGAVTADVEDFSANYYNPAGIVRSHTMRIGAGWFGAFHDLHLDDLNSAVDPVHGTVVGMNIPGNVGDFRFAFGLGVHLPDQRVSRTRTLPRTRPRWELFDNRPHRVYLATHIAIEPWPWLRIGAGIAFLSYSSNRLFIRGVADVGTGSEENSFLEHELTGDLFAIRYPQAGIQVQPIPELSFGLVYRGEMALDNLLAARVGVPADQRTGSCTTEACLRFAGLDIPALFGIESQSVNAYIPHQISLGASWQAIPELRVNLELTYVVWSAYRSPIGRVRALIEADIPPGLAGMVNLPVIPDSLPIAASFSDRIVPRLGVEGTAFHNDDFTVNVRGGYFYEASPAPAQTGVANLVDTDRHAWSGGAGITFTSLRPFLPGRLSLDVHFQYSFMSPRAMIKTSPIDPIGDYIAWGNIFAFGASTEVVFE